MIDDFRSERNLRETLKEKCYCIELSDRHGIAAAVSEDNQAASDARICRRNGSEC